MATELTQTLITVKINEIDYSEYMQFPFKVSNLLDEQLDEASLTLIGVPDKIFKPLTAVTVTVTSGQTSKTYSMLVAEDKADEIPTGSGKYKHELYLIEQTKFLECFVVRSIGYVNPMSKNYVEITTIPDGVLDSIYKGTLNGAEINTVCETYTTPIKTGDLTVYGLNKIIKANGAWNDDGARIWTGSSRFEDYTPQGENDVPAQYQYPSIVIEKDGVEISKVTATYTGIVNFGDDDSPVWAWLFNLSPLNNNIVLSNLDDGIYKITYKKCKMEYVDYDNTNIIHDSARLNATYYVAVLKN